MIITNTTIQTCMGKMRGKLAYLTDEQQKQLDEIGYTGKLNGERIEREDFLNTLNIGTFQVNQTKFDNGDFCEKFQITRVVL
jgi:hypothetical protein